MLLAELRSADDIEWSRAVVDGNRICAVNGGDDAGPNPADCGRLGVKHHVIVDGHGVPLEVRLSAANKPGITQFVPSLAYLPQVTG